MKLFKRQAVPNEAYKTIKLLVLSSDFCSNLNRANNSTRFRAILAGSKHRHLVVPASTYCFTFGCLNFWPVAYFQVLVMAMGITAGVVGFIFLLTTLTDFDFTRKGAGILYIASIAFLLTLLVGMFWVNKVCERGNIGGLGRGNMEADIVCICN